MFSAARLLTVMMHLIAGIAGIVALLAVAVVAALLTAVAISRVRHNRRGSGSLGAAMLEMQSLLEPEKRHTVRAVRADEPESRADSGAPPES